MLSQIQNNKQDKAFHFMAWYFSVWFGFIFALLGFLFFRITYLFFLGPDIGTLSANDLFKAFFVGLRFDLKTVAIFTAVIFIIGGVFYIFNKKTWLYFKKISLTYMFLLLLAFNLLGIINFYFYTFYQSQINALFFGINDDDTLAVLTTLWSDFPVIKLLIILFAVSSLQILLVSKLGRYFAFTINKFIIFPLLLITLVLNLLFIKGGFGTYELRTMYVSVSRNSFVNFIVPNGVFALYLANKERRLTDLGNDIDVRLKGLGFASFEEAGNKCFDASVLEYKDLFNTLPVNNKVVNNSPHVVLAVMESWGRHLMMFDEENNNNLLGELRPWVKDKADYFEQGISAHNGTFQSLEGILLDTPITPLTQSKYGYTNFDTSRIMPYKKAGYKTVFLTAGPGAWRQLNETLYYQGFDEVFDKETILNAYPGATTHTWGVDDEFMFKYALDYLSEADKKGEKVMLFMLSVTNHPPYRLPSHYKPLPLDVLSLGSSLAVDFKLGNSILETYQYANNSLGVFLNELENIGLLNNTIFAATGDHQSRSIITYPDYTQLPLGFGVPFLFYIPDSYKLHNEPVDKSFWISHSDIFPTLWEHSLSEIEVPMTDSKNIYREESIASVATSFIAAGGDSGIALTKHGAIINFAKPKFFEWIDTSYLKLMPSIEPTQELIDLAEKEKACLAVKDWRIRYQVLNTN